MLRPQDNGVRERKNLDGLWRFTLDPHGLGRREKWFSGSLTDGSLMAVPASFNDIGTDPAVRDFFGDIWYQRDVWIPSGWDDRRIVVHFESATHRATVWVADVEVGHHEGGYTPFEFDITDLVIPGSSIRITVAVNNTLTFQSIPPGFIQDTPAGPRQRYYHDFFNYAGLHRSAWLTATANSHLTDLTIVTELSDSQGTLQYTTETASAEGLTVQTVLRNADGVEVAACRGANGSLTVEGVTPWAPGAGYLYDLEVSLVDPDGQRMDRFHQQVGFRTVRIDGTQFLINDQPFYFTGFGMHEDVSIIGKGHSDAHMINDFELLDWIGANSLRTSHYPYSEDVLDYADRRGIVVIDETAAVGLKLGSNNIAGAPPHVTFSPETINERTRQVHAQAITELVARDKNHPSVVVWSIANEPESDTSGAQAYFEPLFALTRRLDPTRPVGFVNDIFAPHGSCRVSQFGDVLLLNRYYGWYVHTGELAAAELAWEAELRAWATDGKPIIVTEYGADTYPGMHSLTPTPWTEEYQVEYLAMNHRVFDRVEAVVGEQVWNFADFQTVSGITRVGGNKKGVFTRDRQPKSAAFELRRRWRTGRRE